MHTAFLCLILPSWSLKTVCTQQTGDKYNKDTRDLTFLMPKKDHLIVTVREFAILYHATCKQVWH